MADVQIDAQIFWERLNKLHRSWNSARSEGGAEGAAWATADALVVDAGANQEDILYSKSSALQIWLFGYEFPNTILVICSRCVKMLVGPKQGARNYFGGRARRRRTHPPRPPPTPAPASLAAVEYLSALKDAENATLPLELLPRDKTDKNKANYAALVAALRSSHSSKVVATLGKEKPIGDLATGWRAALAAEADLAQVELGPALAELLVVKEDKEVSCVKRAAIFSAVVMQKSLVKRIEDCIEEDKKEKHSILADETEKAFEDPAKLGVKLAADLLESCYTPIIQSGGVFDLKPSAQSSDEKLHYGTITCSLGARYKSYCANVGRTLIINPSKAQERNYKLLLELQQVPPPARRTAPHRPRRPPPPASPL